MGIRLSDGPMKAELFGQLCCQGRITDDPRGAVVNEKGHGRGHGGHGHGHGGKAHFF
jgi:hypothetical protein